MRRKTVGLLAMVGIVAGGLLVAKFLSAPKAGALESSASKLDACRKSGDARCLLDFEPTVPSASRLTESQVAFIYGTIICPFWASQRPMGVKQQNFSDQFVGGQTYALANGVPFARAASVQDWHGKATAAVSQDLLQTYVAMYDATHGDDHPATRLADGELDGIRRWRPELEGHGIHGLVIENGATPYYATWDELEKGLTATRVKIRSGKTKVVGPRGKLLEP